MGKILVILMLGVSVLWLAGRNATERISTKNIVSSLDAPNTTLNSDALASSLELETIEEPKPLPTPPQNTGSKDIPKQAQVKKPSPQPQPVIKETLTTEKEMSVEGILKYTNYERTSRRYSSLTLNGQLNKIAAERVNDMFNNQYFAHVSPDGQDVSSMAKEYDYNYQLIGENIILGNAFNTGREAVTAWMNSEGHKENILNANFKEIGIAVVQGEFEGKTQWLGVQVFGTR